MVYTGLAASNERGFEIGRNVDRERWGQISKELAAACSCNKESSKTNLLDNRQHPRLRIIITISTNDQIDLLVGWILTISLGEAKERVLRRRGDDRSREDGRRS